MAKPATTTSDGARERKKRQSRQLITDTATRLFLANGFDAVKVVDIARACNVSEKTVYNYFPTKESLLFDREDEMAAAIDASLRSSAMSSPVEAALELLALQLYGILSSVPPGPDGAAALRGFIELLQSTPSLRAARSEFDSRLVRVAAEALASRTGVDPANPEPQIAAQALIGLWRVQFTAFRRRVADGVTVADGLAALVTADVRRAAIVLEQGLSTFA